MIASYLGSRYEQVVGKIGVTLLPPTDIEDLLTFPVQIRKSAPTEVGIRALAYKLALLAYDQAASHAVIDVPNWLVYDLIDALDQVGILPVYLVDQGEGMLGGYLPEG